MFWPGIKIIRPTKRRVSIVQWRYAHISTATVCERGAVFTSGLTHDNHTSHANLTLLSFESSFPDLCPLVLQHPYVRFVFPGALFTLTTCITTATLNFTSLLSTTPASTHAHPQATPSSPTSAPTASAAHRPTYPRHVSCTARAPLRETARLRDGTLRQQRPPREGKFDPKLGRGTRTDQHIQ